MFHSISAIEVFAEEGLDYVFVDFEHTGPSIWDAPYLEHIVRATGGTDLEPIVRIPSGHPQSISAMIRKVLDTGIRNVVIPRLRTADEVDTVVRASRYEHRSGAGDRGIPASRQSSWGEKINEAWVAHEDATANVGIMVENEQAVKDIDQILAVPHLAFVLVGSMDLSVDLESPTDTDTPQSREAIRNVIEASVDANVPVGVLGDYGKQISPDRAAELHFKHVGSDVGFVRRGIREEIDGR